MDQWSGDNTFTVIVRRLLLDRNEGGSLSAAFEPGRPAGDYVRVLEQVLDDRIPGPVLRPVRLPTAAQEVADRLITAIAVGEYLPGERLPSERELVQILGISRSTVREAIGRLQAVGIVEIRRGRQGGAHVRESWTSASAEAVRRTLLPRWDEMEQLFDLRCLVEGMVARTAAQRRRAEDIDSMREALAAYESAETQQQEHAADVAFHQAVVQATRNPQIAGLSRDLLTRVSLGFPVEPYDGGRPVYRRALVEHTALCESIAAGDSDRAGEIAQGHFTITNDSLRDVLSRGLKGGSPGTPQDKSL
jgi:GntR family transcriptional repressor for pyruvate dehydrogenase complex